MGALSLCGVLVWIRCWLGGVCYVHRAALAGALGRGGWLAWLDVGAKSAAGVWTDCSLD